METIAPSANFSPRKLVGSLGILLLLNGCAAAELTRNAEDIRDDGKRNTVLVSYDLTLDVTDRYRTVDQVVMDIRCKEPGGRITPTCFKIVVPFKGLTENKNGYLHHSFATNGVSPFQTKYGNYEIDRFSHKVLVDKVRERKCSEDKYGKEYCYNTTNNVDETHSIDPSPPVYFHVGAGSGCYLGHFTLHLEDERIVAYDLNQDLTDDVISGVDPSLQEAVRSHVTSNCPESTLN